MRKANYVIASVDGLWVSRIVASMGIFEFTDKWQHALAIPRASIPYVRADFNKINPNQPILFTDGYNID